MVIFVSERGTVSGLPHFVLYTEDGKTPWETSDYSEAVAKYKSLLGKIPVLGVFEEISQKMFDPELIRGAPGKNGAPGKDAEIPQEFFTKLDALISDYSLKLEQLFEETQARLLQIESEHKDEKPAKARFLKENIY